MKYIKSVMIILITTLIAWSATGAMATANISSNKESYVAVNVVNNNANGGLLKVDSTFLTPSNPVNNVTATMLGTSTLKENVKLNYGESAFAKFLLVTTGEVPQGIEHAFNFVIYLSAEDKKCTVMVSGNTIGKISSHAFSNEKNNFCRNISLHTNTTDNTLTVTVGYKSN